MKQLCTVCLVLSLVYALPWVASAQGTEEEASQSRLEMRLVADGEYDQDGVRFDLAEERERLERWLEREGNRVRLTEDPMGIGQFNRLPARAGGPMAGSHLAWYPHLVRPGQGDPNAWGHRLSMSQSGVQAVLVNPRAPFGRLVRPTGIEDVLLELVPINMHEEHFSTQDFDVSKFRPTTDGSGRLGVAYAIRSERADAYADWSERHTNRVTAIIVNGIIRSAPVLRGRIPGRGVISGDFAPKEIDALIRVLRSDAGPAIHLWVARVLLVACVAVALLLGILASRGIRERLQAALPVPAMGPATRIVFASLVFVVFHFLWFPLLPSLVPELDRLVISQSYARMARLRANLEQMRHQTEASRAMGDLTESELVYYSQVVQQGEHMIQQWSEEFSMPTAQREIQYRAARSNLWLLALMEVGFLGVALSVWWITPRKLPSSPEPHRSVRSGRES